jgi:hypothetical protein
MAFKALHAVRRRSSLLNSIMRLVIQARCLPTIDLGDKIPLSLPVWSHNLIRRSSSERGGKVPAYRIVSAPSTGGKELSQSIARAAANNPTLRALTTSRSAASLRGARSSPTGPTEEAHIDVGSRAA